MKAQKDLITKIAFSPVYEQINKGKSRLPHDLPINATLWEGVAQKFRRLGYKVHFKTRHDYSVGVKVLDKLTLRSGRDLVIIEPYTSMIQTKHSTERSSQELLYKELGLK